MRESEFGGQKKGWDEMRVLLIRHADPDYARNTITELGHCQAKALARRLAERTIDRLFVSPLGRAKETARYIAEVKGLRPETLPWLCELDGNYGGERWAWNMSGTETLRSGRVPGLENWHELVPYGPLLLPQQRELVRKFDRLLAEFGCVREGLLYRVEREEPARLAFVSHAGTILTLLSYLLNLPLPLAYVHLSCDPASLTELLWEEDGGYAVPRLLRLNDTSHYERGCR